MNSRTDPGDRPHGHHAGCIAKSEELADRRPDLLLDAVYLPTPPAWIRDQWPDLQRRADADGMTPVLVANLRSEPLAGSLAILRLADLERLLDEAAG